MEQVRIGNYFVVPGEAPVCCYDFDKSYDTLPPSSVYMGSEELDHMSDRDSNASRPGFLLNGVGLVSYVGLLSRFGQPHGMGRIMTGATYIFENGVARLTKTGVCLPLPFLNSVSEASIPFCSEFASYRTVRDQNVLEPFLNITSKHELADYLRSHQSLMLRPGQKIELDELYKLVYVETHIDESNRMHMFNLNDCGLRSSALEPLARLMRVSDQLKLSIRGNDFDEHELDRFVTEFGMRTVVRQLP